MTLGTLLMLYVVILAIGILGARQRGTNVFHLLAYAVNLASTFWLLFLFWSLSSEQPYALALLQGVSWIRWVCLFLAVSLIPVTVVSLARGERSRQREMTSEERKVAVQEMRKRYPASMATLVIAVFWIVFIGEGTFEYFRSHFWLIILGLATSVALGWIVVMLIKHRRLSHSGDAS